ncbi:MAG TPA: helix-turn-helix domain-containing protein [Thermodesulfobacteriota bacterium]
MGERMPVRAGGALTIDEAASLVGVDRKTAYACLRHGLLPGAKVGARWIVLRADLEAWLQGGGRAELEAARALVAPARRAPRRPSRPRR